MNSTIWWVNLVALVVASAVDLRTRRIPNWLTGPFLLSGIAFQCWTSDWRGFRDSLAGIGLALVFFGIPCFLRGMGLGDLKLGAGVAAWIGPGQALFAFIVTGAVGGLMAMFYALRHSCQSRGQHADDRLASRNGPSPKLDALSIPYGPAIAAGALFSFFAR